MRFILLALLSLNLYAGKPSELELRDMINKLKTSEYGFMLEYLETEELIDFMDQNFTEKDWAHAEQTAGKFIELNEAKQKSMLFNGKEMTEQNFEEVERVKKLMEQRNKALEETLEE